MRPFLSGYTFPSEGAPYVIVNTRSSGQLTIYFAENMVPYLHTDDVQGIIISSYSSTLYGYSTNNLRVSWSTYSLPTYTVSGSYQSYDLNITEIVENHLYDYNTKGIVNHNYETILIALMGGVILLLFFKK